MFENLVASTAATERPIRSSLLSVASHAAVLVLAVIATRSAVVAAPAAPDVPRDLPYIASPKAPRAAPASPAPASRVTAAPLLPSVPTIMPVGLPPIDLGNQSAGGPPMLGMPDHDPFTPRGQPLFAPPSDAPRTDAEVDEPVRWLGGPAPVYPPALRAASVEGVVQLRMVIDTLGRVEPSTIVIVASTHAAFEAAAIVAVRAARFAPAKLGGMAVRQLVQQSVRFAIES